MLQGLRASLPAVQPSLFGNLIALAGNRMTDHCKDCPPKPALRARPLLSSIQARELADLFKVLANDTRLRLLHAIAIEQEIRVSDLAQAVGMKAQAVSNQLQRLLDVGILASRREGNSIYYRIHDPCVVNLLDQGWCLMEDARQSPARVA